MGWDSSTPPDRASSPPATWATGPATSAMRPIDSASPSPTRPVRSPLPSPACRPRRRATKGGGSTTCRWRSTARRRSPSRDPWPWSGWGWPGSWSRHGAERSAGGRPDRGRAVAGYRFSRGPSLPEGGRGTISILMDRPLPVLESCDGCGACCCLLVTLPPFRRGFGEAGEGEEAWELLRWDRPDLRAGILGAERALKAAGEARAGTPCLWLDPPTGRCRHHAHRPRACREFALGGPDCRDARRRLGPG